MRQRTLPCLPQVAPGVDGYVDYYNEAATPKWQQVQLPAERPGRARLVDVAAVPKSPGSFWAITSEFSSEKSKYIGNVWLKAGPSAAWENKVRPQAAGQHGAPHVVHPAVLGARPPSR